MLMPAPAMLALFVHIGHFVDRAAVNAHPHVQFRMFSQCLPISNAHKTGASGLVRKTSATHHQWASEAICPPLRRSEIVR